MLWKIIVIISSSSLPIAWLQQLHKYICYGFCEVIFQILHVQQVCILLLNSFMINLDEMFS